ncbi:ADP-ribosylglycohydrolase family protein [Neolewinella lacunae]|uniref:ADP-ribosylglycohydrolase family protein n=1 Tax=Neolewinella lacunae TaxID=1517758 RepID=A0A923T858_9BACT|nr:ADP-ribosylglycohydrolase family protein [Neolewinella lacunae]MBC6994224.1 ADP-ribosylglycohydrolase family protein [Neolewinella lacunae]MDN3634617.1 ADP-ribosylglycohydrolase family protein [Neolewinella lacunae]
MNAKAFSLFIFSILAVACQADSPGAGATPTNLSPVDMSYTEADYQDLRLADSLLYDKILGSLVGSAIGDAMGAPTEMWHYDDISEAYGYVDSLDLVLREPSPEGPWDFNLPPGAGTDDTRWKDLMVRFALAEHDLRARGKALQMSPVRFAAFLNQRYESLIEDLKATEGPAPEPFEDNMRRITWLQEWTRVSRAYAAGDIDVYRDALARFYGGEMACAGMLYAPVLGAVYPGQPLAAYRTGYDLALFDIGYARDVTGLTAALTAVAFQPEARLDTFAAVLRDVDPQGFFRSRLLGRLAYKQYQQARAIVREAKRLTVDEQRAMSFRLPDNYPYDSLHYAQTLHAYRLLTKAQQDAPFHAGEIHLINLTALLFSELDFPRAMEFITNYGRDNDTVAAVTGAILGALHGFQALPEAERERVMEVNREVLNIDLEALARRLTDAVLARRPRPELPQ